MREAKKRLIVSFDVSVGKAFDDFLEFDKSLIVLLNFQLPYELLTLVNLSTTTIMRMITSIISPRILRSDDHVYIRD